MRKILLFAAALLTVTAANAKVWRINYEDNAKADFKTIKEACNEAKVKDGDTLYMEPGYHKASSSDNTITRPLTVLGPGYGMERNSGSTSSVARAIFDSYVYIYSSNVHVAGLCADLIVKSGSTESPIHDVLIERCYASVIKYNSNNKNITIRNNFVTSSISYDNGYGNVNYLSIIGNIVLGSVSLPYTTSSLNNICQYNTIISKSGLYCSIEYAQNAVIKDNILINTSSSAKVFNWDETNEFRNNVLSVPSASAKEKFPNNYYVGATIENTFVNTTEGVWYDEAMKYQLLETSAAKNAAHAGDDCGAFGGANPYVLFGRPQGVPYIYDVEVPAQPKDNKLHVTFKVAGQNE